jgi:DNA-binding response OmpR family regulator
VLVVSPFEDNLLSLKTALAHSNLTLCVAAGAAEAKLFLHRTVVPVILCESELPDGSWKDLSAAASGLENPPLMVVTSRLADEYLWAEVLNLGGYDVLAQPFNAIEVVRVIGMACRRWRDKWKKSGGETPCIQYLTASSL